MSRKPTTRELDDAIDFLSADWGPGGPTYDQVKQQYLTLQRTLYGRGDEAIKPHLRGTFSTLRRALEREFPRLLRDPEVIHAPRPRPAADKMDVVVRSNKPAPNGTIMLRYPQRDEMHEFYGIHPRPTTVESLLEQKPDSLVEVVARLRDRRGVLRDDTPVQGYAIVATRDAAGNVTSLFVRATGSAMPLWSYLHSIR